tara:strand:- start:1649 stop:1930 length:282 start_codon:yes stop_codon:yes gene_type:complete
MEWDDGKKLFEALAKMDSPLSRACERAIDTIKNNPTATEEEKALVKNAVSSLLKGNHELHDYLGKNFSEFNFIGEGQDSFIELRKEHDGNSGV